MLTFEYRNYWHVHRDFLRVVQKYKCTPSHFKYGGACATFAPPNLRHSEFI